MIMVTPLPLLSLLSFIFLASADVQRRTPAGLTPFTVDIRSNQYSQFPINQFRVASSGASFIPPNVNGPFEVDVVECETLSPYWNTLRGEVTYFATTKNSGTPPGSSYEINGYIYPRIGQPVPKSQSEASDCYNNAAKYFAKKEMEKAKGTFVIPGDQSIKRFIVSNNPFQDSLTWQLVRFRVAPQDCISTSSKYFIPKNEVVTASNAKNVCSALGAALVDVNFKNIYEINNVAHSCQGSNIKFYVASWNGYDFGLGSMVFTSSVDQSSNGAVTVPDNGKYLPICQRVTEKLRRDSITDQLIFFYDSEGIDLAQGTSICQQENRPLADIIPPPANTEDKTYSWVQARVLLSTNSGPFSAGWIGSYNGAPAENLAFFNGGDNIYERGTVSVPPGGSSAKVNGVFCGPVKTQVRRSEL